MHHQVHHHHVVRIHEVMATKKSIVVMEFVGGGSLNAYLVHHDGHGIGEASVRRASSSSSCMHSTTSTRILKPDKILVDATSNIKVTNFGLSTLTRTAQQAAHVYIVYRMSMFRCSYGVLFPLVVGCLPFNHKDTSLYHMIHH
jgi:serine/threonine protein kinase